MRKFCSVFDEYDDQSTFVSSTSVSTLKEPAPDGSFLTTIYEPDYNEYPKHMSFPALKIDEQLDVVKFWLDICEGEYAVDPSHEHRECQQGDDLVIPAKRVLDLQDAATGVVRIVETAGREGRYAALSHCWGGDPSRHPLMTVHATLEKHMSGIALSDLPQSFRDAIRVCRHLDIQYIWIDCLCICQDDRYHHLYSSYSSTPYPL